MTKQIMRKTVTLSWRWFQASSMPVLLAMMGSSWSGWVCTSLSAVSSRVCTWRNTKKPTVFEFIVIFSRVKKKIWNTVNSAYIKSIGTEEKALTYRKFDSCGIQNNRKYREEDLNIGLRPMVTIQLMQTQQGRSQLYVITPSFLLKSQHHANPMLLTASGLVVEGIQIVLYHQSFWFTLL